MWYSFSFYGCSLNLFRMQTFFTKTNSKIRCWFLFIFFLHYWSLILGHLYFPGLSPDLQSMEQVRRVMRPTDVPDQGLLCDLLWADPDKDVLGWGENDRGVSFTFGADVVTKFLHKHDMDLICRAHQVSTKKCNWMVQFHGSKNE